MQMSTQLKSLVPDIFATCNKNAAL